MDLKKIKAIVDLVNQSNIAEIEITEGEEKLKITSVHAKSTINILENSKQAGQELYKNYSDNYINSVPQQFSSSREQHIDSYLTQNNATQDSLNSSLEMDKSNQESSPSSVKSSEQTKNTINSPMVGTFYRKASPTSAAFVEVGQEVKKGQVLCIIEAMKLMNQIETDQEGIIEEILISDGTPVEYNQPLFTIKSKN